MADLEINIRGDSSGAQEALRGVAHEASGLHEVLEGALKGALGSTVTTFSSLETVAEKAAEVVKDFFRESIEEYAKAERMHKQLQFVAKENTEAFEAQARAISASFAVKEEDIEHLQTLALRYGVLPTQIEGATKGVLNFAAATGQDANSAMMMLIRGVEAGHGSLGRMGIKFEETGTQAGDMAKAIEILNDPNHFGKAGETDAQSLAGRMRQVTLATDDLKKSFGEMFATIESKTGVLENLAQNIKKTSDALNSEGFGALFDFRQGGNVARSAGGLKNPAAQVKNGDGGDIDLSVGKLTFGKAGKSGGGDKSQQWSWGPFGNPEQDFRGWEEAYQKESQKQLDDMAEQALKVAAQSVKDDHAELMDEEKHDAAMLKAHREVADQELKVQEEADKKIQAEIDKANAEQQRKFDQLVEKWEREGDRMGAALVNAIGAQLIRLAQGGDFDVGELIGDVVQVALTTIGMVIGTAYGVPQLGGALGGLAGSLGKAGITSAFKHHDGGWIERFHGGGWPMAGDEQVAILQTGERVLSRREVANMGGRGGVESAARGGGGMTVNISAIDTRSFQDSFAKEGGRGFFNAIRVGRGDLVPIFNR